MRRWIDIKSQMFRLHMSGKPVKSRMHVNRFQLGAITGRMRGATIQYFSASSPESKLIFLRKVLTLSVSPRWLVQSHKYLLLFKNTFKVSYLHCPHFADQMSALNSGIPGPTEQTKHRQSLVFLANGWGRKSLSDRWVLLRSRGKKGDGAPIISHINIVMKDHFRAAAASSSGLIKKEQKKVLKLHRFKGWWCYNC